jgi:hypothetical protein
MTELIMLIAVALATLCCADDLSAQPSIISILKRAYYFFYQAKEMSSNPTTLPVMPSKNYLGPII